ncbi:SH3 domain-containing protein [Paenibacillus sp. FSL H8-0048]|uniref:SH3 domain-containing protein n=1 Tax=Paenibacillus sp. FSL H8-0048 TaxID=2954508 RepID=UPI0030FA7EA6
MVKYSKVWSKCLAASIILFVAMQFHAETIFALHSSDAKTSVWDVKTSGLNVRSGPGTSYPIIAQVSLGTDLVNYAPNGVSSGPTIADNQAWLRNYYPNASIGYYANAALGWSAYYNTTGPTVFNYHDAYVAKTSRVTWLYNGAEPNLGNPFKVFPANYYLQNFDRELKANPVNPNAWRVRDESDIGYVNGWDLKAE